MNIISHITLSIIIYDNIKSQMPLDKSAFIYGNIKPDLDHQILAKPHILDNYLIYVCNHAAKLMNEEMSIKEFSMELGQICHYVCDFFCCYHMNQEIFNHLREHFLYEWKLHFVIGKIDKKYMKISKMKANRNMAAIIFQMRKAYLSDPFSMEKDIDYAISTSIWICESVSYFLSHVTNESMESGNDQTILNRVLPLAGGQS